MTAEHLGKRPMRDAPKDGSWIKLLFQDMDGTFWSNALYRFSGSYWTAPSGIRAPSHLTIIGWKEAPQ
jgi:hypothetical protein